MTKQIQALLVIGLIYSATTAGAVVATKWGVTQMYPESMQSTVGWSSSVVTILAAQANVLLILAVWSYCKKRFN